MGTNTFRYYPGRSQAPLYWRRRFLALVIGLTALALITWGFSGALGTGPAGGQLIRGTGSGPGAPAAVPPGSSSGPTPASRPGGAGAAHRPSARSATQPNYCSKHSIVLSLSSTQATFGPGQQPAFSVSVVSTQSPTCAFNVGPGFLKLVVRKGWAPVWNSADCVRGAGVLVAALRRGIPTAVPFSWNLQTSAPGCPQPTAHVPPGLYTAVAELGPISSNPVSLRIS